MKFKKTKKISKKNKVENVLHPKKFKVPKSNDVVDKEYVAFSFCVNLIFFQAHKNRARKSRTT